MPLPFSLVINGQAAGINILAIFIYKYNTLLILYITPYFRVVTMAERSNEIAICCVRLLEARGCGARPFWWRSVHLRYRHFKSLLAHLKNSSANLFRFRWSGRRLAFDQGRHNRLPRLGFSSFDQAE